MKNLRLSLTTSALALLLAASSASADQRFALGAHGELYRLLTGTPRSLGIGRGQNPILALSISRPDQTPQVVVIPGTEGEEVESSAMILHEESSDSVFVIWESRTNYIHSQIKLGSLSKGAWSAPIVLSGEFFSLKTSPRLAVTRDSFMEEGADGQVVWKNRTIYHAVWWEEAAAGERVVYSPVTLIDGAYIGWNPLLVLNTLGFGAPADRIQLGTRELAQAPTIQPGRGPASLVIGFTEPASRQFVQLEVDVVSGTLSALAEKLKAALLADSGDPSTLSDRARGYLIDFGARLGMHPSVVSAIGQAVTSNVISSAPAGEALNSIADRARGYLIDFGVRLAAQGVTATPDQATAWLVQFPTASPDLGSPGDSPEHVIRLRRAAARPIPQTESGATFALVSRSGFESLVAWQVGNLLRYRETEGGGWSDVRTLRLDDSLSLAHATSALEQRTADR